MIDWHDFVYEGLPMQLVEEGMRAAQLEENDGGSQVNGPASISVSIPVQSLIRYYSYILVIPEKNATIDYEFTLLELELHFVWLPSAKITHWIKFNHLSIFYFSVLSKNIKVILQLFHGLPRW
ncbi:hypothetical protein ACJX0J_015847, partial [Zea mays]